MYFMPISCTFLMWPAKSAKRFVETSQSPQ